MSAEQQRLEAAIAALEAQRANLGDEVVESLLAPARARLAALMAGSEPVAPAGEPQQALKQVSILFMDVVGSTTLSQSLDPEGVSAVMDDALARGTAIVQAHRGKVLQYAGDNILAAFGVDGAAEDDAERAVRCGLALLELGRALGDEVLARHGHGGFNVRVGVHTGGVLLGGGVDAEGTIRGTSVNIAARMEQTAPPGALRISSDTHAQVRGMFEVEPQEPLQVKGIDHPVQTCLVLRARPRSFRIGTRGIEGVATRMIGRDAEFEQLQIAFRRLLGEGRFAAVTVVGEAGIGKSRLLYEFEAWSEAQPEGFFLFRSRATPQTIGQAYGLMRDIFAWRFQIADDDSLELARRKMEDGVAPLFLHDDGPDLAQAHAHLLAHLIGIDWKDSPHLRGILDDARQIRSRAFHAAAQVFRRIGAAASRPVVLQLDDLHWADEESLDFLDHLGTVNRDTPLLVLGFTRPDLFDRRSDWAASPGAGLRIDLGVLDKRASRELADELLKSLPEVPAALRDLLASNAEGNPFYMEELVKMLIERGAIRTAGPGEPWSVDAQRLLVAQVPTTLVGVLQARLDGLPPSERQALRQASVVGPVFWDQALAAVQEQAVQALPRLEQREMVQQRPDAPLVGLREFGFRSQVLHQVSYDTVLKRHKQEGHAKVARWLARLAGQAGPRAGDLQGLTAEHFERAGEAEQAAEYHARAAEHAGQRLAHGLALEHAARALTLLGQVQPGTPNALSGLRWRLHAVRETTFDVQGRRDEQAVELDAMDALADGLNDDRLRAEAARRRGISAMLMADWPGTERSALQGLATASRCGDEEQRLQALRLLALARAGQGDLESAEELAGEVLEASRRLGLRHIEARALSAIANIADLKEDLVTGLEMNRQCLAVLRELGDRLNESMIRGNLGFGLAYVGSFEQARPELEQAVALSRANGDTGSESSNLYYLAFFHFLKGDGLQALTLAKQALDLARSSRSSGFELHALWIIGLAEQTLGRRAEARVAYAEAKALAVDSHPSIQLNAVAGLASVELAEGDNAGAVAALQPLFDYVAGDGNLDSTNLPRLIEFGCHQALAAAGDPRADEWLVQAHTALMDQARKISDAELRRSFLGNIPWHREILAAWQARGDAATGAHPGVA